MQRTKMILEHALNRDQVLITADKDFGELVFVGRKAHGPIVRLVELTVDEQLRALTDLFDQHGHELTGPTLVTVALGRVRIRSRA